MTLYKSLGFLEYTFIGVFALFYFLYITRMGYIAFMLRSGFQKIIFKIVLRTVYIALLIIALLAPSFGDIKKEIKSVGKDIFILVDLSKSMDAIDIVPSRIEKIKFELKNIIKSFNSDRLGIIVFSSEAFVQCPMTYDQGALLLFTETMSTNLVPNSGTNFAPALNLALDKLLEKKDNGGQKKSKIIVLISDGEDFGDNTSSSVDEIKSEGVKLFSLGIGTEKGGKIPNGNGYVVNNDGETVISTLNNSDLKKIANKTNGKYYEINPNRNDVNRLIEDISNIQGELITSKTVDTMANKYFYFVFVALILIVFDVLATIKIFKL
ncbi:MAG: VWA domain-containing protein [Cytophagales bacterium]|nr:VWA domain-containing protein [Cytophagales bacterium]